MMRASLKGNVSMCFILTPKRPYAKLLGHGALLSQLNNNCLGVFPNVAKLLIYLYNLYMTKQQLTQLAGSQAELARLLNISRSAVCQWVVVPELQLRRLKDLRPQWFTA
jgi:hypothetical protein